MLIYDKNELLTENNQLKKFLIAVDFKNHSEKITNVALNFLKGIPSEFTFFHSLQSNFTREEAEQKMADFILKLKEGKYYKSYFRFKTEIFDANAASSVEILHNANHYDLVFLGSSNNPESKMLGKVAKKIFLGVSSNFLIIPPQTEIKRVKNVSILIEDSLENLPLMNVFRRYLKCQDVFINLVMCREHGKIDDSEQKLIKSYQKFFNENLAFPTIYESNDLMEVMCQNIPNSDVDFFGICWDENTKAFQALLENDFRMIPSFTKIPLFISKEKQVLETKKVLEEVVA